VINRTNIDTLTTKFEENTEPMKWYDEDEMRSVLKFVQEKNNIVIKKFSLKNEIQSFFQRRRTAAATKLKLKKAKEKIAKNKDKFNFLL
jgi:hypothetical protein